MRKIYLIIACLICTGCASFEQVSFSSIKNKMSLVETSNGINDQEAIVLAQNFIISKGLADRLYSLKPVGVEKKNVWKSAEGRVEFYVPPGEDFQPDLQEYWMVLFRDKEGSQFFGHYAVIPFYVKINAKTGEVIRWGLKTDNVK
jgi:hypothetical protein